MYNKFYLIQRGKFRDNLKTATDFFSGKPEALINPEYMGSAEFEWGAIPRAFRRIMGQYTKYKLFVTDIQTVGGVPFCVYCREDKYDLVLKAIKEYLEKDYRLKEWTNMHAHFTEPKGEWDKDHRKRQMQTNFWWCIDQNALIPGKNDAYAHRIGDWIAFTGAADRQNAFTRVMDLSFNGWWMNKSAEDREKEFYGSFK